jgi:predicted nucleotidyltransferase
MRSFSISSRSESFCSAHAARDDAQARSDYDIAIDDDELTLAKLAQIRADMEIVPTLLSIDVVWMNRAVESLRKRILNEGKILYEHHPTG